MPCGFSDVGEYSRPVQKYSIKLLYFRISWCKINSHRLKIIFNQHRSSRARELIKSYFLCHKTGNEIHIKILSFLFPEFSFSSSSPVLPLLFFLNSKIYIKKIRMSHSLLLEENKVEMPMEMGQHHEMQC